MELHSVIAELSRQLELKEGEKIVEEEEPEEEEDQEERERDDPDQGKGLEEDQVGEGSNGVDPRTQSELASRTSTDIIDAQAVEVRHSQQSPSFHIERVKNL